jgi:RNA-directed DNA polymerase
MTDVAWPPSAGAGSAHERYRPGKSAHGALAACWQRCWKYDWAIELDVQKFFDDVPWDRVIKAVRTVTDARWVLLYVERWLAATLKHPDGALEQRTKGTPQGSAVSPILVNLFMHYALDVWMARNFPDCPFERYADDAIVHCKTRRQAEYCMDGRRRAEHEHTSFTFLGYAFRARGRAARTAGTSPGSCQRSAPRRSRPKAPSSAGCGSTGAPTCRWTTWRGG